MLRELEAYYQKEGIYPLDFHCPYLSVCRKDNENFIEAKSAFVGSEYEKGTLPRLLFLSLDPGSSERDANRRTPEAVRYQEEHECNTDTLVKSRHWYRTHEMAWRLLKKFKPNLDIQSSHLYFAHINTVKCCVCNKNHASAPVILFKNCQRYIWGEIEILKPDILITQGKRAREALKEVFGIFESEDYSLCRSQWIRLGEKSVLWFPTYHPRNFGVFNRQRKECFAIWAQFIYEAFHSGKKN
ncbi:uracil-DNA glycosylase family protein [Anaerolinea sp.]|uniref:uracil-DNA glycosylase family protein n=1 Tax=Anaerolinea sp. TaxID=1872519 RepID=UPI002ACE7950|nr:uracil-DNA glycosylase family protein [Anaerolinea sp.]